MKKLNYLECEELAELQAIIDNKNSVTKQRLNDLLERVKEKYSLYIDDFSNIYKIATNDFNTIESADLQGCYTIKTRAKTNLVERIVGAQTKYFQDICGYCLINKRTTIDHYIPETTFPVFSVLARNLVPCCSVCNQKKLEYWRESNNRGIIHLYNDLNFDSQFLFAELELNNDGTPRINFTLDNDGSIPSVDFYVIERHFERLDLISRYNQNIDLVISTIVGDISDNLSIFGNVLTNDKIKALLLKKANRLSINYGNNYWEALINKTLAESEIFITNTLNSISEE